MKCFKVKRKLKALHSLCVSHQLLDELYHGQVVETLLDKLPYELRREFKREKVYGQAGDSFRISRQDYFAGFMTYVEEKARELTIH